MGNLNFKSLSCDMLVTGGGLAGAIESTEVIEIPVNLENRAVGDTTFREH